MRKSVLAVASMLAFASVGANAADFTLGGVVGISGAGVEASAKFSEHVGVRANVTGISYNFDYEYDGIDYDTDTDLTIGSLWLDLYPAGGVFRITLGASSYDAQFGLSATPPPGNIYLIGGTPYPSTQVGTLTGNIEYKKVVPYVGIGWDFGARKKSGFGVALDLGVFFRGDPDSVTLTSSGTVVSSANLALESSNIEDDTLGVQPTVAVSFYYRF